MSSGSAEAILAIPAILAQPEGESGPNQVGVDIDINAIVEAVEADGVSAPAAELPGLLEIVAQARARGDDLSIVVVEQVQPVFTVYRDIATEVQSVTGGTVLVFGPNSVGSASDEYSRVTLENAGEKLPLGEPTVAARQMYDDMTAPAIDWTIVTIVLVVVVIIGAVIGRLLGRRGVGEAPVAAKDADTAGDTDTAGDADAETGAEDEPGDGPVAGPARSGRVDPDSGA